MRAPALAPLAGLALLATLAAGRAVAAGPDDTRPAAVAPIPPPGWVTGSAPVVVRIEHPAAPLPASGIRGYAVSVDRGGTPSSPCLGPDRCTEAELDLPGGIDDDTLSLGFLPQGAQVVRAVAVSGAGLMSAEAGSAVVHVDATPPRVELRGVPRDWANGPVRLTAVATDALSGMAPAGPNGPSTAIAIDGRVPKSDAGGSTTTTVTGNGAHVVGFSARDAVGNVSGPDDGGVAVVRIDEQPPRVAFVDAQDPFEPERLEASVEDSLAGPDPTRGSIAVRPRGGRQQFTPLPTAVSAGRLVASWDSDAFPAGTYEFRATGYDGAGNSGSTERRANGTRMVLPNPLKSPTRIVAGFGGRRLIWHRCAGVAGRRRCRREVIESFGRRPTSRSVRSGHGTPFAGILTSAAGASLGGLPVQVVERFDPGSEPAQRTTTVETAADGTFLVHLAPGPSRQVEAVFAGSRVLTRAGDQPLRLDVLSGVRMHSSAATARIGGAPVVFSGGVTSDGVLPRPGGIPVELQFRLPHGDWREFRTVQTDPHGHFRYPYAFSDDDSRGVRFEFRAFVPAQEGWPYEPTGSSPTFVSGR